MKYNEVQVAKIKFWNEVAYLIIALIWGFSHIADLAVQFFYKDVLKVEPTSLLRIHSFIHIPWAIKPIFGLFTDLVPILGYRRKSYLIICALTIIFCYTIITFFSVSEVVLTLLLFTKNLGTAFISVVAEAMLIEHCQLEKDIEETSKDHVSYFQFSKHLGYLLSSYLSGLFVDVMNLRTIFFMCAVLPIFYIIAGFMYVEVKDRKKVEMNQSLIKENSKEYSVIGQHNVSYNTIHLDPQREIVRESKEDILRNLSVIIEEENHVKKIHFESTLLDFWNFITRKQILVPIIFIVFFMSTPSYYDPYFYFLTNVLKIKATVLGQLSFLGSASMLIGIIVYKYWLKDCNFKIMIIVGTIFSALISLCSLLVILRINIKLGISDFWLLLFTSSFLSILGEFILMPILSLTCMLCPKNLEGTIFSVFTSALNLGRILAGLNGSVITSILHISSKDYVNLPWLIVVASLFSLVPLPILCCISDSYFHYDKEEDGANKKIELEQNIVSSTENNDKIVEEYTKIEEEIETKESDKTNNVNNKDNINK